MRWLRKLGTALAIAGLIVLGVLVWWFLVGFGDVLSGGSGT
jgi:hypothetical protein